MIKQLLYSLFFSVISLSSIYAQTIVAWDFNNITPGDVSTAFPSEGEGRLRLVGDINSPTSGSSGSPSDPGEPNLALQTTGYPEQSTGNKTSGVEITFSTIGLSNIFLRAEIRTSNTASRWVQVQYAVNDSDFLDVGEPIRLGGLGDNNAGDTWHPINVDLSTIDAINDAGEVSIRIVSAFSPIAFTMHNTGTDFDANTAFESARNPSQGANSNYGGGTLRFDLVSVFSQSGPVLTASVGSFNFNQLLGAPSEPQSFILNASNLNDQVVVSTTEPFELSLSDSGPYFDMLSIPSSIFETGGVNIFCRLNSLNGGSFVAGINISSDGAQPITIELNGEAALSLLSIPQAHRLSDAPFQFTEWSADAPAGTFPDNMVFWTHSTTDPLLTTAFLADYSCLYNLGNRSRFLGEGERGISFLNTGNAQFIGVCDGSDPEQMSGDTDPFGRVGAIIVALNTEDVADIRVDWTGRTIAQNSRVYALTMQYKIGTGTDPNSGWLDFDDPVSYLSGESDTEENFSTMLPEACNGQSLVLVRWVYHFIEGGGSRAHMGLDDIQISSQSTSISEPIDHKKLLIFPNPVSKDGRLFFNDNVSGQLLNIHGKLVRNFDHANGIEMGNLQPGMYLLQTDRGIQKVLVY